MSQWTHFLGVIRFESMLLNVWPEPRNKRQLVNAEADEVHRIFQCALPSGSEGPVQIDTNVTRRGPTVLITGDLRDFGKGELKEVVEWVNGRCQSVKKSTGLWIRDAMINCDVEFNPQRLLIVPNDENVFELVAYNKALESDKKDAA